MKRLIFLILISFSLSGYSQPITGYTPIYNLGTWCFVGNYDESEGTYLDTICLGTGDTAYLWNNNGLIRMDSIVFADGTVLYTAPLSSKWTINGSTLHPIDTTKFVALGTDDAGGNAFKVSGGRVLFGSDTSGIGYKMMWIPNKFGAFRAGFSAGPYWDYDSIGNYSVSFGNWNRSTGAGSFTCGGYNRAIGIASFSANDHNTSRGDYSTSFGQYNITIGANSFIGGLNDTSYGNTTFLHGQNILTRSALHTIFGSYNDTTGYSAWSNCVFSGTDPIFTVGIGDSSINRKNALNILKNGTVSFLNYTFPNADGNSGDVLTTDGSGAVSWQPASGGASYWDSIAGVIHLNDSTNSVNIGKTALIGTEKFGVYNGSVLFSGTTGSTPTSGAGTRMMWIPAKKAFRAGEVSTTNWDAGSIGEGSAAWGLDCKASNYYTTAGGYLAQATAAYSTAFGDRTTASNTFAFAAGGSSTASGAEGSIVLGYGATASGKTSFATNYATIASGDYSSAHNYTTTADAYAQSVFGRYNVTGGMTAASWVSTDRLFVIGNGTGTGANSNDAFRVLKNGTTYIGDASSTQDPIMTVSTTDSVTTLIGVMKLVPMDDPPASPDEGMIYVDTDHHIYYWNGTAWKQLDN